MPRTVSSGMQTHLDGTTTNLAHAWKITLRDPTGLLGGPVYRFTNHDRDKTISGIDNGTYIALQGGSQSSIEFRLNLQVNNLELRGFLDELHISEADLIARRFYRAEVRFYIYNWANPAEAPVKTIRGWIGEVTREGNAYVAEVRSLAQALKETIGSVISERCRALPLGTTGIGADRGCNYPVDPDPWEAATEYGDQPTGKGAQIIALPNGSGDWDAGGPSNGDVQIVSGGTGYSNNLSISAYYTLNDGTRVKWDAVSYTVSGGVITDVFFPFTSDGSKPGHSEVQIVVVDIGGVGITHVSPTVPNGFNYRLIVPGTSGATEPTWPTTLGATVTDGTATWETVLGTVHTATVSLATTRKNLFLTGLTGTFTPESSVLGSGAIFKALPNGEGLWDGNASPANVDIINGGLNYRNPEVTALFVHPVTQQPVEWVATMVGTDDAGRITYVNFPATIENEKPESQSVTFVTQDSPIEDDAPGGYFDSGTLTFLTGENLGIEIDIDTFEDLGGGTAEVNLHAPAPFDITYGVSDGTRVSLKIGCDGRWQTCKNRFRNQLNFRGEPGIPGTDVLFRINTNL